MRSTITKLTFFAIGALVFSSCKKRQTFGDVAVNTFRPIVEFSDRDFKSVAMDYSTSEVTVDITDIRFMIRSDIANSSNAKITLSTNAVEDYNDANGTSYTPVSVPLVALAQTDFTLTPDQRSQTVKIRLKPIDVFTGDNAIGIVISDASNGEVSEIADTLVVALSVKNRFDGVYRLRGFHNRTSPDYTAPYDEEVELITSGANSVYMYWEPAGGPAHPIAGGTGAYSNFTTNFIFDPATNKLVAWDLTPYPTTIVPAVGPATDSRWDPATGTIYAQFYYNNNPTQRGFTDTLTFLRPR